MPKKETDKVTTVKKRTKKSSKKTKETKAEPIKNAKGKVIGYAVERRRVVTKQTKFIQPSTMPIWEKIHYAGEFFSTDGVVQNIFLTQIAMGMQTMRNKIIEDQSKGKVKRIYDDISRRLQLHAMMRCFYLASLIYHNVYMVEYWGKRKYKWGTSTRVLEVPIGLTLIDPMNGRILGSSLGMDEGIGIKVERNMLDDYSQPELDRLNKKYLYPIFDGEVPAEEIHKYSRRSGNKVGDQIFRFNPEVISHYKPVGFEWERYGEPRLSGCFVDLQKKRKLQEVDFAVCDGIVNMIYLFKLGTDEMPMDDNEDARLASLLTAPSRSYSLVWNHRISGEVISPDKRKTMISSDDYEICNNAIRESLGYTFGMTSGKGRRDIDKLVKMFVHQVEMQRGNIATHFEERLYRRIMEKNNLPSYPHIRFNHINLSVDNLAKVVVGLLYDRGLITRRTALEIAGLDYDEEKIGKIVEAKDGAIFPIPPLPYNQDSGGTGGRPSASTKDKDVLLATTFDELVNNHLKPAIEEIIEDKGLLEKAK